jgi:mono/diheme cytochrome c family protein
MKKLWLIGVLVLVSLVFAACSGSTTSSSPTATTSTTTPPAAPTAGELAESGQGVYASRCSSCHGSEGQGGVAPRLIGSGQTLATYTNAQGLLSYISSNMPANSPGSLTSQQYLEVAAYLLLRNEYVMSGQALENLGGISLE